MEKSEVLKKNWAEKLALQVEKAYLEERSKGGEKEEMNGKSGNIEVDLGEESQENELLVKFSGSGARKLDHGSIAYEVWLYEIKRYELYFFEGKCVFERNLLTPEYSKKKFQVLNVLKKIWAISANKRQ